MTFAAGFCLGAFLMALARVLFPSRADADRLAAVRRDRDELVSEVAELAGRLQHALLCESEQRAARTEAEAASAEWHEKAVRAEQALSALRKRVMEVAGAE